MALFRKILTGNTETQLNGERIYCRPPRLSDWPQWVEVRQRNEKLLRPFEPRWSKNCLTEDFFKRRLDRQTKDWIGGRNFSFLIFDKTTHALIGGININHVCRGAAQFASLGYWLDDHVTGQGYMQDALNLILHFCFNDLNLHRVNASCVPHNDRSKKTLLCAGFTEEGFTKAYLQIDGQWQDHILFGLCREDFDPPEK